MKPDFPNEKIQEICSFASLALKEEKRKDLVKTGIEAVGDLARNYPEAMAAHIPVLLDHFIGWLKDPELDQELKPFIFTCIGDFSMQCIDLIKPKLDEILEMYIFAFEAVYSIISGHKQARREVVDMAESIKATAVESFSLILHGLFSKFEIKTNEQFLHKLSHFIPYLNRFIAFAVREDLNPSEVPAAHQPFVLSCFYLLTDLGAFVQPNFAVEFDHELLKKLKKLVLILNADNPQYEDAIHYFESVFRY